MCAAPVARTRRVAHYEVVLVRVVHSSARGLLLLMLPVLLMSRADSHGWILYCTVQVTIDAMW
jgi:hypothetical protein